MPLTLEHTPRSRSDLLGIWSFVASDSERAADRLLGRIDKALMMLCDHPNAGRSRPDIMQGLRSFVVGNYVIFYLARTNTITVVRVLEGHRDIETEFADDAS